MIAQKTESVRRSAIAGTWYPGTQQGLLRTLDTFLEQVDQPPVPGELLGLIVPHAGYVYSGQTAAYAFRQVQDRRIATVVVIAPSHRAWVGDFASSAEDAYETPLGLVPVDRPFVSDLAAALLGSREKEGYDDALNPFKGSRPFVAGPAATLPLQIVRGDVEHAVEIQLPFLQHKVGSFSLVPLLMSADSPVAAQRLASALAEVVQRRRVEDRPVLLVASSDMHHLENYAEVVSRDARVIDAIAAYDLVTLSRLLMEPACSVCGRMPILTVMHTAKLLGANSVRVLHRTNSGDVTGQRRAGQYTVGYMAAALFRTPVPA